MFWGTSLIKAGRKFGGDGGADFDDSLSPMFTVFHYLSGFIFSDVEQFRACQFIYTSSERNQTQIRANVHGDFGYRINTIYKFNLTDDERIEKVRVHSSYQTFTAGEKPRLTTKLIRKVGFITTKGRSIPPDLDLADNGVEFEQFPGYTVGYVTGRSGGNVDQLQFVWYRTKQ